MTAVPQSVDLEIWLRELKEISRHDRHEEKPTPAQS